MRSASRVPSLSERAMGLFSSSTQSRLAAAEPAPISGPLIAMRSLEKVFETPAGRMYVLSGITVDVQAGELISVMGPSGAGKSTLLSIVGMLAGVSAGDVYFVGPHGNALLDKQCV